MKTYPDSRKLIRIRVCDIWIIRICVSDEPIGRWTPLFLPPPGPAAAGPVPPKIRKIRIKFTFSSVLQPRAPVLPGVATRVASRRRESHTVHLDPEAISMTSRRAPWNSSDRAGQSHSLRYMPDTRERSIANRFRALPAAHRVFLGTVGILLSSFGLWYTDRVEAQRPPARLPPPGRSSY